MLECSGSATSISVLRVTIMSIFVAEEFGTLDKLRLSRRLV